MIYFVSTVHTQGTVLIMTSSCCTLLGKHSDEQDLCNLGQGKVCQLFMVITTLGARLGNVTAQEQSWVFSSKLKKVRERDIEITTHLTALFPNSPLFLHPSPEYPVPVANFQPKDNYASINTSCIFLTCSTFRSPNLLIYPINVSRGIPYWHKERSSFFTK